MNPKAHPIWNTEEFKSIKESHVPPKQLIDYVSFSLVQLLQLNAQWMSGYRFGATTPPKAMRLALHLETIAAVPGLVAGIVRYTRDMLGIESDNDWLYTSIQEAEIERIHLLCWMQLYRPSIIFRLYMLSMQIIAFWVFFGAYLVNPRFCHRFVGYLEELALEEYMIMLKKIDDGRLGDWKVESAPLVAQDYWEMAGDSSIRDMLIQICSDEARHRDINHAYVQKPQQMNPFIDNPKAK
jgi:hypothetical protein